MKRILILIVSLFSVSAYAQDKLPFSLEAVASFDEPWAMAFLPDGRLLITEKKGALNIVGKDGKLNGFVRGLPNVDYGRQGGLGDIALHPDFENNNLIYVSYAEGGPGATRGAAVARGVLTLHERYGTLTDVEVVWRQYPKVVGYGHYGHRILFDDEGYLWISSGDRQKFTPAQDMQSNIGKIVRLNDDGSIPSDNPFVDHYSVDPLMDDEGVYPEIWSIGHRNPLGMAFDAKGQLWDIEMGPRGGDELNLVERGANYGYPIVSNGEHYDGRPMPDHDTDPSFAAPAIWWTPTISPGDMMLYSGRDFPDWKGDFLVAGLSSEAIIRIEVDGKSAKEVERYEMGARIRSVAQDPAGNLWVLEDDFRDSTGRLLKLGKR
ncbi:MAG: PQQ-dependent sugar dehydrogenase [Pseudomonadota bacterium]